MQVGQSVSGNERIDQAIRTGSATSGLSFDYMARTAYRESSYKPDLKATTSSATGLYQFLDQIWLEMLKEQGPSVGLDQIASSITKDKNGRYDVANPAVKQQILNLRNDPTLSAVMAGKMTEGNVSFLQKSLGRTPTQGEAYIAHVLGPTGGTRLIQMKEADASQPAAVAFPREAAANEPIFYAKDGRAKSAGEVYDFLARQHGNGLMQVQAGSSSPYSGTVSPATRLLAQAQAQALPAAPTTPVMGFSAPAAGTDSLRTVRTSIGQTSIPGDATATLPPAGGQMSGWRAKEATSAFAALMRSDGATAAATPIDLLGLGGAAPASGTALPVSTLAGAYAPLASRIVSQAGSTTGAGNDVRPSRVLLQAAAAGAPGMALPMVTDALGVARPSRFSAAGILASQGKSLDDGTSSGIRGVHTTAIDALTYGTSAGTTTGQGAAAMPASTIATLPSVPDVASQPLDLLRYRKPLR